jgi:hypothetical protein
MASGKAGQATIRGRFAPGSVVTLTKVAGEHVLRPEGGEDVGTGEVKRNSDGVAEVKFSGLEVGARYIAHGISEGAPVQVRVRGRKANDPSEVLEQPPIGPDRVRLTDGSWADEKPTKESAPGAFVGPGPGQHQVGDDVPQRSSTLRGSAHPVEPGEPAPFRDQTDVPDGVQQMSDTKPREVDGETVGGGGQASEIVQSLQRQEDSAGVPQRSDTVTGQAQPIPKGDAVNAQQRRESSAAKESRGDTGRAAAEPVEQRKLPSGKANVLKGAVTLRHEPGRPEGAAGAGSNTDGFDAQGQPIDPAIAATLGIEPGKGVRDGKAGRGSASEPEVALPPSADPGTSQGESETEIKAATGAGEKKPSADRDKPEKAPQAQSGKTADGRKARK